MARKTMLWKTKGMNKDLSVSAFNPEFAFENMNLRLSTKENNTLMSWVNEKGTAPITLKNYGGTNVSIKGVPVGTAVLNKYLVIFTHEDYFINTGTEIEADHIYRLIQDKSKSTPTMSCVELYEGNLHLSPANPLETLVSYESEDIQKVYWTDGINQPRVINIAEGYESFILQGVPTIFDFVSSFSGGSISVKKNSSGGLFAPGVIQYCFCYFNKYGQQSNIVEVSPLYYLSYYDKGASPESKVSNSFQIKLTNLDTTFKYVRVYSIQRTSLNLEPFVKLLTDIKIDNNEATFLDTGTTGSAIDPTELLYVGGREISALTMADKDGTLFLGNIQELHANLVSANPTISDIEFKIDDGLKTIDFLGVEEGIYPYRNSLDAKSLRDISTFKGSELYRFGYQLQKKTGEWTDPIFISDKENTIYPKIVSGTHRVQLPYAQATFTLKEGGLVYVDPLIYQKIRPLIVYPNVSERRVLCQGVLNPTVFNIEDRMTNSPFAQASWYFRPCMNNYEWGGTSQDDVWGTYGTVYSKEGEATEDDWVDESVSSDLSYKEVYVMVAKLKEDNVEEVLKRGSLRAYEIREDSDDNGYYYYNFIGVIPLDENTRKYAFLRDSPWSKDYFNRVHSVDIISPNDGEARGGEVLTKDVSLTYVDLEQNSVETLASRTFPLCSNYVVRDKNHYIHTYIQNGFEFRFYSLESTYGVTIPRATPPDATSPGEGIDLPYKHYSSLQCQSSLAIGDKNINKIAKRVEIQGSLEIYSSPFIQNQASTSTPNGTFGGTSRKRPTSNKLASNTQFFVDQSIVTLNSPDIEFDTDVQNYNMEGLKLRIVGYIPIKSTISSHSISTSSSMIGMTIKGKAVSSVKKGELSDADLSSGVTTSEAVSGIGFGGRSFGQTSADSSASAATTNPAEILQGLNPLPTPGANPWLHYNPLNGTPLGNSSSIFTSYGTVLNTASYGEFTGSSKDTVTNTSFGAGEYNTNVVYKIGDSKAGNRLVADYLWNDALLKKVSKDKDTGEEVLDVGDYLYDYLIHPWQRTGSLNNDFRSGDKASSMLRIKKEANLLFSSYSEYISDSTSFDIESQIMLTENSYVHNIRLGQDINYYPNVDKVLYNSYSYKPIVYFGSQNDYDSMSEISSPVSMKYKSTSHAVIALKGDNETPTLPNTLDNTLSGNPYWDNTLSLSFAPRSISDTNLSKMNYLWLGELYREEGAFAVAGDSSQNRWMIGGDTVSIDDGASEVTVKWTQGDTYYQRYDCLKTYPFTQDDANQLVEILSFMCETHVNIDGRYDRNRGQIDNTNMRPEIFNLLNPVYSQKDNFFTYSKVDSDISNFSYPNQITYSKAKTSGADIDLWTKVTLASMLELDGDKGAINSLQRFNDQLIAFQDTGISQILYNENTQISTTNGVPIEIANSGKVQGKRYLSDTIGCSNKWSIVNTPSGIYFMDSNSKGIYLFNGELSNVTLKGGFDTWSKNIPSQDIKWGPSDFNSFVGYYDRKNQDILFINKEYALAFSEKLGAFTSFYSYGNTPYLCNIEDIGVWLKPYDYLDEDSMERVGCKLWQHQAGEYCKFFGENKPYWTILVGNPDPQLDKTFTNLEFRASVDGDVYEETKEITNEDTGEITTIPTGKWIPYLPFDNLETWNEYQHGVASLGIRNGWDLSKHHLSDSASASLNRKFRIWRCDIPRDNVPVEEASLVDIDTSLYTEDKDLGISRIKRRPLDRMRNPWIYLKMMKRAAKDGQSLNRVELHDMMMAYFE